ISAPRRSPPGIPRSPSTRGRAVPSATSVGAAALDRFTRPVAWQNVPDAALPPALREDNPWGLPRRVDGVLG
ncbi:MAG TPA: hypothetical protein PLP61_07885, partial [Nocardioides sp.]|nr:hypothetical protein [Nocardioides sp.]